MAAPKGHPKWGGRRKGSSNKATREIREMVQKALDQAGGIAYLKRCALDESDKVRAAFLTLVGKLVPISADVRHSIPVRVVDYSGEMPRELMAGDGAAADDPGTRH